MSQENSTGSTESQGRLGQPMGGGPGGPAAFAGVLLMIVGVLDVVQGLVAITRGSFFTVKAEYLDGAGDVRGFLTLGPVTPGDRHNVTTLLRREGTAPLPAGTRSIRVTLTSVDADKAYSSALADNVKLTLAVRPPVPPTAGPGGGNAPPPAAGFGALTQVGLEPVRTRLAAGKPLRLRLRNANGFAVAATPQLSARVRTAGRARRVRARGLQVDVAPFSGRVVKVALPGPLRKQLARRHRARVRAAVLVRDPAGTTRRVALSLTLKTKGSR